MEKKKIGKKQIGKRIETQKSAEEGRFINTPKNKEVIWKKMSDKIVSFGILAFIICSVSVVFVVTPVSAYSGTQTLYFHEHEGTGPSITLYIDGHPYETGTIKYSLDATNPENIFEIFDYDELTVREEVDFIVTCPLFDSLEIDPVKVHVVETGDFTILSPLDPIPGEEYDFVFETDLTGKVVVPRDSIFSGWTWTNKVKQKLYARGTIDIKDGNPRAEAGWEKTKNANGTATDPDGNTYDMVFTGEARLQHTPLLEDPAITLLSYLLGRRASEIAKEELCFVKDAPYILAMTDAGYAIVGGEAGGRTTERCIDGITASSGCTIGKGNLLLIHRSKEKPLWFAFFNKSSGECVYLEANDSIFGLSIAEVMALPDDKVFTKIAKANIGADELFANPEAWPKVFGGNEFSIITIANVWAKGAPYEFMKAAEFHNHICPGLTSGYLIVKYLDENLPLQSSRDKYEIIACPPWCKDDAFQVIFDKTVGKRFVAMHLTPEDSAQLPEYYAGPGKGGVAGIFIRWNGTTNTGHGMVLAYNRTKTREVSNIPHSLESYRGPRKLKTVLSLMDYLDQPETFVTVVQEFYLNSTAELMELKYAGNNPYVELGLLPDPALADFVGPDNIAVGNRLGCRASEFAMKNMSFEKYDPNILTMTDAGYAVVNGTRTENCIDGIMATTGCTVGKGNLLVIHRSRQRPLWFAFFDKTTGDCLYIEANCSVFDNSIEEFMALPDKEVFTRIVKENVSAELLLNESYAPIWNAKMRTGIFGGGSGPFTNEFTFITIPNVWAKGNGSPRELLAASQFHNHICPGLTAGYFILEYLDEHLPLEKPSQQYQVIAIPPYCKDDVLQWNLEATIGNKNYVAKDLTPEQKANLSEKAKNVAGIFIRWDRATGTGDGLVLAFNWTKACEISEFPYEDFWKFRTYKWWFGRLKMDLDMMDYIDEPETVVETIMEFDVNSPSELSNLKSAGVNPLDELGLMGNKWTGTQSVMVVKPDGTTQNVSMTGLPKHHFLDPGKDLDDPADDVNYDAVKVTDFLARAGLSDADLQGKLFNFVGNDGFASLILHRAVSDLPTYDYVKGAYLHYRPRGKVNKIYTITVWWTDPYWLQPGAEKLPYAMDSSYRVAFLDKGGKIEVIEPSMVKYWQGDQTLTVIDNKTGTITHTETVNLSNIETETVTINGTSQDAVRLVRVITNGGRTHLWGSHVDVRPASGPGLRDTVGYDNLPRWYHSDIFADGYFYLDGPEFKLWFYDNTKAHWRMDQDLNGGTVEILPR